MSVVVPPMSETTKSASAGEKTRSDDACRRTRQDGLDRVLERNLRLHQRAVAFDDHQRSVDRLVREHARQCLDQMADLRREARVQRRRQRAARSIELASSIRARRSRASATARESACARAIHAPDCARRNSPRRRTPRRAPRVRATARVTARFVERRRLLAGRACGRPGSRTSSRRRRGAAARSARPSHRRSRSAACRPGLKRFSTTALVASVVDTDTRLMSCAARVRRQQRRAPRGSPCRCRWQDPTAWSAPWRSR